MIKKLISIALILFTQNLFANLLQPDEAFKLQAKVDNNKVILNWEIAAGYYLYKDKIKITTDLSTLLADAKFSANGKVITDDFFGKVEIYRNNANIVTDILQSKSKDFIINVSYQGCADIGVCYPPINKNIKLSIANFNNNKFVADKASNLINKVSSKMSNIIANAANKVKNKADNYLAGDDEEELLPGEQAFEFFIVATSDNNLIANWDIKKGYYLYKDKIKFNITGAEIEDVILPKGKIKNDEFFGKVEIYRNLLEAKIILKNIASQNIKIEAKYQGCADIGVCYPPQTTNVDIILTSKPKSIEKTTANKSLANDKEEFVSEQDSIANLLKQDNIWWVLLSFFGFGLLLSFTPCVFPMIPILSGIIAGQGESITTKKAFSMSVIFVLSVSIVYSLFGMLAGYLGENLQIFFQSKWAIIGFSAVFVALALSMFGFYDIQMPKKFQQKAAEISNKQKRGSILGVIVMGALSAIIVGPCVAAPLAGALIYIGQTGDVALGGLALFALSLGMGFPLILIGASMGKLLPKAGSWMNVVKAVFGVLMLAVAIYLLERILSPYIALILWASLITISAIYMGALDSLRPGDNLWRRLFKALGLILLGYGLMLWLLVARGGGDMFQPLSHWNISQSQQQEIKHLSFKRIKSSADLDNYLNNANSKLVMLDFYADWCISCKELEKFVFSDVKVINALENSITLQADVTKNDVYDKKLMQRFDIIGPPAILFFRDGKEIKNMRLVGELDADEFLNHINRIL